MFSKENARVVKEVDTPDLKSDGSERAMRVRFPPRAPSLQITVFFVWHWLFWEMTRKEVLVQAAVFVGEPA